MNKKWKTILRTIAMLCTLFAFACSTEATNEATFTGTIMSGFQLGEVKSYCTEGLYLVAEEGAPIEQPPMVLLTVADTAGGQTMLSDPEYIGKKVEATGKYPGQEAYCEALICSCDDSMLVDEIKVIE